MWHCAAGAGSDEICLPRSACRDLLAELPQLARHFFYVFFMPAMQRDWRNLT
jgi:hypothetical protein